MRTKVTDDVKRQRIRIIGQLKLTLFVYFEALVKEFFNLFCTISNKQILFDTS
jgi:hypothetical protein